MAEILPVKGWRYHERLSPSIEELSSPLFDVVSEKQRKALYSNPLNSIHLSVPIGENPVESAKELLHRWKMEEVLVQDKVPGIYVYYQYFKFPGQDIVSCRKGFIAQIKAYDWPEAVVLRHENTIAKSVNDRFDLLKETLFQSSATHGLYEDALHQLEPYMDQAMENPIYDIEDYQGVREVLAVIHDAPTIQKFVKLLQDKQVILADGHHRYEAAIALRKWGIANNPAHHGQEAYNYHMMYFTNALSKDLRILPTHRMVSGISCSEEEVLERVKEWFTVRPLLDVEEIPELIQQKPWSFGLVFQENAYKISLKPEVFGQMDLSLPGVVKEVDLMVLHYFFLDKVLGFPLEEQRYSEQLHFERSLHKCLGAVESGKASLALITKEISMQQVLEVCKSGYTMPQKSTYFYPKTLAGLLFASVEEEDFAFPYQVFQP